MLNQLNLLPMIQQMIVEAIKAKKGVEVARRQIDSQPLRMLGEYKIHVRLTMDLMPEILVIVHREGETIALPEKQEASAEAAVETAEPPAEA
jgi:large subunit ribosomal protein L9